jgi:hypothetical protein
MAWFALFAVLAAWIVAWPILVALLGWPAIVVAAAWAAGLLVVGLVVRGTRGARSRNDPVSRLEARSFARDRYEQDRLERLRARRGFVLEQREQEADERIEARIRDLVDRAARRSAERADAADEADDQTPDPPDAPGARRDTARDA